MGKTGISGVVPVAGLVDVVSSGSGSTASGSAVSSVRSSVEMQRYAELDEKGINHGFHRGFDVDSSNLDQLAF